MRLDGQPLLHSQGSRRQYVVATCACLTAAVLVLVLVVTLSPVTPASLPANAAKALTPNGKAHFGSCAAQPSVFSAPLRWGSKPSTADHICCHNERYAEYFGYWETTDFLQNVQGSDKLITFFDTATGRPLFIAPRGRTMEAFLAESKHHGWPSFRDAEVVWENVLVKPGGETVSVNGTHLGHNLPDSANRYCINIVCIAGHDAVRRHK